MPPLWNQRTPLEKISSQSKVAGLDYGAGFVRAVVEDHRRAHAKTAIAVDGRHVGAIDAVVLEILVEGGNPHQAHPFSDQVTDRILHHRRDNTCLQTEAVRQIGSHVVLTAAGMHFPLGCLAEGNIARIDTVVQRTKRNQVKSLLQFSDLVRISYYSPHVIVSKAELDEAISR